MYYIQLKWQTEETSGRLDWQWRWLSTELCKHLLHFFSVELHDIFPFQLEGGGEQFIVRQPFLWAEVNADGSFPSMKACTTAALKNGVQNGFLNLRVRA